MPDDVRRTIALSAHQYSKALGTLNGLGLQPNDLAQEGFLYALQFGRNQPALQVFIGRKHMRQYVAEAAHRALPRGTFDTDITLNQPMLSKRLSMTHKGFEKIDTQDLLEFILARLSFPQWKLQIAIDLITGEHTGAFWAKQRNCSKQRIFAIKQEFLAKSRKILNLNAA